MKPVVRRLSPADVKRELKVLEERHGISTPEFFERYKRGEMHDMADTIRWLAYREMSLDAAAAKKRVRSR
jgi:hypothetical protein